jgi:TP901 family phage tail tape measure protein
VAGSEALEVSLRLMLEGQAEIARALAAAGGKAGDEFYKALSPKSQKAFDDLANQAEKAAKEVGAKFSKTDLRFRNSQGQFLSPQDLDALSKANAKFAEARKAVDLFRSAVVETGNQAGQSFNLLESAITGVAVSLTSRLTDAVGTALTSVKGLVGGFLELDGELRLAAAAAGEQGGYERLAAVVDKVGIEAAGTTKQVAELATSLVRAGFSIKEVEAALPGVVKGAEATGTSFASFGDIVGNTLRGFGLEVEETSRVVDVLVNTANSSNASIEGLGYTFEYTAPIAKALGVSLEEVAAAAGLMANAGIQGSVAGTGFREGLQKLQQAAGGASPEVMGLMRGQERLTVVMRKLGATVVDTNGKLLPLDQVLIKLKGGLERLNQADQVQLANVLFGDEAGSKFLAILNQSDAAINKLFGDIKNSAGATDTARTAMAGMGLELQQLQGTMDSLGTSVGGVIASGLRPLVSLANAAAGAVSGLPAPVKAAGGALIALGLASTGTAVAVGALNLVVGQIGSYTALRTAVTATVASFGGIAAGTSIVLGLAAGIGLLSGNFREVDRTTKVLIQTTASLAAVATVYRGVASATALVAAAQNLWNNRLKTSIALSAVLQALTPKLVQLAFAAGAAVLAFQGVGALIKVTGEDTEELSGKTEELRDEIKLLQDEIEKRKKLNLDTTEAQKKLDNLQLELQQLQAPLEIKLDIQRLDGQIRALGEKAGKLGNMSPERAALQARIDAFRSVRDELIAAEKGTESQQFEALSKSSKDFVRQYEKGLDEIDKLNRQKLNLPGDATDQRNKINKRISDIQSQFDSASEKRRLAAEGDQIQRQIELNKQRIEDEKQLINLRQSGAAQLLGPDDASFGQSTAQGVDKLQALEKTAQRLRQADVNNKEAIARAAKTELRIAKDLVASAKEKLETEKLKLETQQASASLTDRQKGLESGRLRIVQQIADAYSGLASAQAALVQSGFDVDRSRNSKALSTAEQELQILRDRGASIDQIQAKEREIARIKRDGEVIEYRAMDAAIKATAERFEIERKILELKQRAQLLEQEGAVRSARQGVLSQEQRMLDLRGKMLDSSLLPAEKAEIQKQIKLQEQSIQLSKEQEKAERDRLQSMGLIFGLERQTQAAQQQTASNQQRAAAAAKGWESAFSGQLAALDNAAGISYRVVRQLVGTIEEPGKPVQKIYEDVLQVVDATQDASSAWKLVNSAVQNTSKATGQQVSVTQKAIDSAKELAKAYLKAGSAVTAMSAPQPQGIGSRAERYYKGVVDQAQKQAKKFGEQFSYAFSENGMIYSSGTQEADNKIRSWYSKEELAGIMKIENATKMSADAFFEASEKATYLERTLSAIGKEASQAEKMKWYARALSMASSGPRGSLDYNTKLISLDEGPQRPPADYMDDARRLANKQSLGMFSGWAGGEKFIDQLAAELADADASARNLRGSIDGVRDGIGNVVIDDSNPLSAKSWEALHDQILGSTSSLRVYGSEAQKLADAYKALGGGDQGAQTAADGQEKVNTGLDNAIQKTQDLSASWESVYDAILNSADALKVYSAPPTTRWAGGFLDAGQSAVVNELGTESFLSRSGVLSLIQAPRFGTWAPPSPGMVLPAGITSRLDAMGAFDRGGSRVGPALAGAMPLSPGVGGGFTGVADRLERRMASLEDAMRTYRPMDVQVHTPSNAGLLRTLQGL